MRRFLLSLLLFAIVHSPVQSNPTTPVFQGEIDYLIGFIADSGCTYLRNGSAYSAAKAVQHIQRKYDHYREEIGSTEDFIELSASRSSLTGKEYMVKCGAGDAVKAKQWLLSALKNYRNNSHH